MQEVIFNGQKHFTCDLQTPGIINVDITFVEHTSTRQAQYVEIVCLNIDQKIESKRLYIAMKLICDMINQDEIDKNKTIKTGNPSSSSEFTPLSSASLRSVLIQKLLDLLNVKSIDKSFSVELSPLNGVELHLSTVPEDITPFEIVPKNLNTDMIFENTMDDVKREADTLDSLTSNIKEIGTLMTSSVESLVSGFQKNILSSFTSETLGLAAQEIVDDSLLKKGQRKHRGKQVVLDDLTKQWEKNEKNGRDLILNKQFESLMRNNSFTLSGTNNSTTVSTSMSTSVQALSCSGANSPSREGIKHSPRLALTPLEHIPSLPKME